MKEVIKYYEEAEKDILEAAGRALGEYDDLKDADIGQWEISRLERLGDLDREQQKILAEASEKSEEEIRKWLMEVTNAEVNSLFKQLVQLRILPEIKENLLYRDILTLENELLTTVENMGLAMRNNTVKEYSKAVETISREIIKENISVDEAMYRTAKKWADSGVTYLTDRAGRKWKPDVYLRMVSNGARKQVMTTVKNRGYDDNNIDLVYVTSLADSRPSHIEFEGKIYSRSGKSKEYPPLEETGYGSIDGIETGINCRHRLMPYVEGATIKRTEEVVDEKEKKKIEENYRESQKQRYHERQIRQAKREVEIAKALNLKDGGLEKAKKNLANKQRNMRDWIKTTGRNRNYKRERVVI